MENRKQLQIVTFQLGSEEYGIDILQVYEIKRVKELSITRVPRAPSFMKGIANLRGDIIPIIDLHTRFSLKDNGGGVQERIIVVTLQKKHIGLMVDVVKDVITFMDDEIQEAPEEVVQIGSYFINGIAKKDGRLIILLDIEKVLTPQAKAEEAAL